MKLSAVPQVTTSQHMDAARLLLLVPKGGFLELRALLLERLDRHMEALRCLSALVALPVLHVIKRFASRQCTCRWEAALSLDCQMEAYVCGSAGPKSLVIHYFSCVRQECAC